MTNYFAHPTAVIDEGCEIHDGAKIWHFSHIMSDCVIGTATIATIKKVVGRVV